MDILVFTVLTLSLSVLKLLGFVSVTWWVALSPMWLGLPIFFVAVVLAELSRIFIERYLS